MTEDIYEERLETLEEHAKQTERQVSELTHTVRGIAQIQATQSAKLDAIAEAVTAQKFAPKFDFKSSVQVVRDLFAIAAIIASLSIWLILTLTAANDQVTDVKIDFIMRTIEGQAKAIDKLDSRFGWTPRIEGKS